MNSLNILIRQDPRREIDCYIFCEQSISNAKADTLYNAHHDVLDMFLSPQPLIAVEEKQTITGRGHAQISHNAKLIRPELLQPPYDTFLINNHALDLLEGETITEQMSQLIEFYTTSEEKIYLINFIEKLTEKGLYLITCK